MHRVVVFALSMMFVVTFPAAVAVGAPWSFRGAHEVSTLATSETDVEVFMLVNATRAQIDGVERHVARSALVRRYAQVDKRAAYREFKRIFRKNQELVHSIRPSDLPESFRVDLRSEADAERFATSARHMRGVESAEPHWTPTEAEMLSMVRDCNHRGDLTFEVFMRVSATQAQLDATRQLIEAQPGVQIVRVLSKDDAYAEFTEIFASQPDLLRKVGPQDLPMSIRVHADGGYPSQDLIDRVEAAAGVESVETPSDMCIEIGKLVAQGLTPEQVAKFMFEQVNGTAA